MPSPHFGVHVDRPHVLPVHSCVASTLQPNDSLVVPVKFAPVLHDVYSADITFIGNFGTRTSPAYGIASSPGHPFLHVVIEATEAEIVALEHYLGSAKIMAGIGKGFAEAVIDLQAQ